MNRIDGLTEQFWTENECDRGGTVDKRFCKKLIEWVYRSALCDVIAMMEDGSGFSLIDGCKDANRN